MKTDPTLSDIDECKFLSGIKDEFVLEAIDFFINTDWTKYNQLVFITELALFDLDQYMESLKKENMKED